MTMPVVSTIEKVEGAKFDARVPPNRSLPARRERLPFCDPSR